MESDEKSNVNIKKDTDIDNVVAKNENEPCEPSDGNLDGENAVTTEVTSNLSHEQIRKEVDEISAVCFCILPIQAFLLVLIQLLFDQLLLSDCSKNPYLFLFYLCPTILSLQACYYPSVHPFLRKRLPFFPPIFHLLLSLFVHETDYSSKIQDQRNRTN
jgi:hypothetical protein